MDIIGVGTDIVECVRIARMIEKYGELFLNRIYTFREIRYCRDRKHATEHFASRWAAKEAVLKCLGPNWNHGLRWTELEIRNDATGVPRLHLAGLAKERTQELQIGDIHISMSHCRAYASAFAVAVKS